MVLNWIQTGQERGRKQPGKPDSEDTGGNSKVSETRLQALRSSVVRFPDDEVLGISPKWIDWTKSCKANSAARPHVQVATRSTCGI